MLRNALHPLLFLNHEQNHKATVPFSMELDEQKRILLVSGPNAGGKSVALKALGLLQYMFQCGLPLPVGDGSSLPVFQHLFADIGDEQSIENSMPPPKPHQPQQPSKQRRLPPRQRQLRARRQAAALVAVVAPRVRQARPLRPQQRPTERPRLVSRRRPHPVRGK